MHSGRDSVVDVRTQGSSSSSLRAVSAAETRRVSGVRTGAQRCRRRQFASDHMMSARGRNIQHPGVTAHMFARATDRPNPDDTSLPQTCSRAKIPGVAAFGIGTHSRRVGTRRRCSRTRPSRFAARRGRSAGSGASDCTGWRTPSPMAGRSRRSGRTMQGSPVPREGAPASCRRCSGRRR